MDWQKKNEIKTQNATGKFLNSQTLKASLHHPKFVSASILAAIHRPRDFTLTFPGWCEEIWIDLFWGLKMQGDSSPTTSSPLIRPINRSVVHRICSGQVILDLSSAIKELVENSIDAGATSIEINLRDYGEDYFQVIDNGCGISPTNFKVISDEPWLICDFRYVIVKLELGIFSGFVNLPSVC